MKKLKRTFERLLARFARRKSYFERTVETWGKKGRKQWHEKGKALLSQLEKEASEIKTMFTDAGAAVGQAAVKTRIKLFKKLFKQLHESTKPAWRQWLEALLIAGAIALLLRNFIFGLYHVPTGSAEPTILVGDRVWGNKLAYIFDKVKRGDLVIFDNPKFKYSKTSMIQRGWQKYVGVSIPLLGLKSGPINVVKRVIAIPGDWIEGRVEDGKTVVYLNGEKLDEPYVNPYPLIWLDKKVGFLPFKKIGPLPIPSFLRERSVGDGVWYTYVPGVPFEEQPYYNMKKSEVIQIPGYPSFRLPYTPSAKSFGGEESADSFGPMRIPEGKYWVMGDSRKNSHDSRWFKFLDEKYVHGRLSFIIYSIDSQEPFWLFELIKHPIDFWGKAIRWNRFFKRPDN